MYSQLSDPLIFKEHSPWTHPLPHPLLVCPVKFALNEMGGGGGGGTHNQQVLCYVGFNNGGGGGAFKKTNIDR